MDGTENELGKPQANSHHLSKIAGAFEKNDRFQLTLLFALSVQNHTLERLSCPFGT